MIERAINRRKRDRRIATRDDKLARSSLAMVTRACLLEWIGGCRHTLVICQACFARDRDFADVRIKHKRLYLVPMYRRVYGLASKTNNECVDGGSACLPNPYTRQVGRTAMVQILGTWENQ